MFGTSLLISLALLILVQHKLQFHPGLIVVLIYLWLEPFSGDLNRFPGELWRYRTFGVRINEVVFAKSVSWISLSAMAVLSYILLGVLFDRSGGSTELLEFWALTITPFITFWVASIHVWGIGCSRTLFARYTIHLILIGLSVLPYVVGKTIGGSIALSWGIAIMTMVLWPLISLRVPAEVDLL